jgi:hypothetical protein
MGSARTGVTRERIVQDSPPEMESVVKSMTPTSLTFKGLDRI